MLQPFSPLWAALSAYLPWEHHTCPTYVLRQGDNGLARVGFAQWRLLPEEASAWLLFLAPALDAPLGHPAVWQKVLTQSAVHLANHQVRHLFAEGPDQPLVINTLSQAGFQRYTGETIWRLVTAPYAWAIPQSVEIRPQSQVDAWALEQLYHRLTPAPVRQAEAVDVDANGERGARRPPILHSFDPRLPMNGYVLMEQGEVAGCVQIIRGKVGVWLRLWTDLQEPDRARVLLRYGLQQIIESAFRGSVYIAVREYEQELGSILSHYGFAPFTDRARLVRQIWQWAKRTEPVQQSVLEPVGEVAPGSLAIPKSEIQN
ncbi:MAG: hypothetical protein D6790_13435 [Caldilineae bacterium]|nr:MAG: hypothetical protein D6790_13435 [Caldilineae bacterium]